MRAKIFIAIITVLSLLFSASALAHITQAGGTLPHIFTGEHLLILVIVGVFIAGISKLYRRTR